jgi:uncharacterized membrane protein
MATTPTYDSDRSAAVSSEPAGTLTTGERSMYMLGGLVLAAAGAKPRPNMLLSLLALGAGAYLAWRGAEGTCPVKAMITGRDTHLLR